MSWYSICSSYCIQEQHRFSKPKKPIGARKPWLGPTKQLIGIYWLYEDRSRQVSWEVFFITRGGNVRIRIGEIGVRGCIPLCRYKAAAGKVK